MKNINFFVLLAAFAAALSSCGTGTADHDDDDTVPSVKSLVLRASATVIEADGIDAVQLEVLADGVPVTEGVRLYDGLTNTLLELPSMTFTTTEPGNYYFWAAYGTKQTEMVQVCGFCPGMIEILRSVLADEDYASRVIHTAAHTYKSTDPAYLEQRLDQAMGVSGYPTVVADMAYSYDNYLDEDGFRQMIDLAWSELPAKAGISVSTSLAGNQLVVMASVKAAETSMYSVGAWLLEDGIEGKQANYHPELWTGDYGIHDNCIRYADSRVTNIDYSGFSLGTVEAGQTSEYVFTIDLDEDWVADNCHVVVFVTVPDEKGRYYSVTNAVDVPLEGSYPFEYASSAE